jgi:hypothetical protein
MATDCEGTGNGSAGITGVVWVSNEAPQGRLSNKHEFLLETKAQKMIK